MQSTLVLQKKTRMKKYKFIKSENFKFVSHFKNVLMYRGFKAIFFNLTAGSSNSRFLVAGFYRMKLKFWVYLAARTSDIYICFCRSSCWALVIA